MDNQNSANHPKQPRRLLALQRRRQALSMRLAGADVAEIAATLGVTNGRVSQLIGEAMADLSAAITADAEQMREMQRRDIMAALAVLRQSIASKDPGERMAASDRIARLWARLSELYGLDAPEKKDIRLVSDIIQIVEHKDNGSDTA
jgi:predicted transcriptional regulator